MGYALNIPPLVWSPARWSLAVGLPDGLPVELSEVKAQLSILHSDDDALLASFLTAASDTVERKTRRALLMQTRVLRLNRFPCSADQVFELPGGVIQSVTSITYRDATTGDTVTWDSANWTADLATSGGTARIGLAEGQGWPDVGQTWPGVTVTYVAGWAAAEEVPEPLKVAIRMMAADLYDHRSATVQPSVQNPMVEALLSPWRILRVA